jgi:NTE family protein
MTATGITATETAAPQAAIPPTDRRADLVLEGGGVKGIGIVGAVVALDQAGYVFPRVAGTSAGAIGAALIAALQRAEQPMSKLQTFLENIEYSRFMEEGRLRSLLGPIGDVEQLLLHMGLYDGDYLVEWLDGILTELGVTHFGDLKLEDPGADANLTEDQRYTLIVHTSDISRGKCVRLPWDYEQYGLKADHQRIVDAVRASMSIPFFFQPVRFRAPKASVDGVDYAAGPVTWVDGGMLDNFPIEVFDRTDGAKSRWETIGIKLSARVSAVTKSVNPDSVVSEAIACLHTTLDNADRYYVTPDRAARTIFVDNGGIKATDFRLTHDDQELLFNNGHAAATDWLKARGML